MQRQAARLWQRCPDRCYWFAADAGVGRRFAQAQAAVGGVERMMALAVEREPLIEDGDDELPVVCAWCKAVVREGEVWRPVTGPLGERLVSHGICPSCLETAQRALEPRRGSRRT